MASDSNIKERNSSILTITGIHRSPTWNSSLVMAVGIHVLFALFLLFGPAMYFKPAQKQDVLLVRLRGGGENRPGWIKPTTAQADRAKTTDGKPKAAEVKKEPVVQKPVETPQDVKKPLRVETKEEKTTETVKEKEVKETTPATVMAETESGEGIGAKPGPEGSGFGATSDADFPGADAYLSRLEAEVQRRFNFRGRGSGAVSEYHFFIEKNGKVRDLILMKASGIASLDMAARSSIIRAKFPPLPRGFKHDRLGVTYLFYDAQ